MRVCQRCKVAKPETEFYKKKARKDGLDNWCKTCAKAYNKKYYKGYYEQNRDKKIAQVLGYMPEVRRRKYKKQDVRLPVKVPTQSDIDWAIGIYEGEGCCSSTGKYGTVRVSVSQKDPQLLVDLLEFFGGSIYTHPSNGIHSWNLYGEPAKEFLLKVYNFPRTTARRKAQINKALQPYLVKYESGL